MVNSKDQISEIPATLSLSPSKHETNTECKINIFPDSGASICLAGPTHLHKLNFNTPINLYHLRRLLLLLVGVNLNAMDGYQSSLPLVLIPPINPFSRQDCLETKIMSTSFQYPMPETTSLEIATLSTSQTPPTRPSQLPYPTTIRNIPKLENYTRQI